MPIKIQSIRNIVQNKGIKILVHGLAGAGKTVLCCTTGEPTLLISAESNSYPQHPSAGGRDLPVKFSCQQKNLSAEVTENAKACCAQFHRATGLLLASLVLLYVSALSARPFS